MLAELTRQDQIANDLANASTPGYKADTSAQEASARCCSRTRATGQPIGTIALGARIIGDRPT